MRPHPLRSIRFVAGRGTFQARGAKVSVASKRWVKACPTISKIDFYVYITAIYDDAGMPDRGRLSGIIRIEMKY